MKREHVRLDLDASGFVAAMQRAARATRALGYSLRRSGRAFWRNTLTPGERHIDRIARDCAARRLDATTTARRLMVATDAAAVIDGTERAA